MNRIDITDVTTIGILGVGRVGTALARQAMRSGFQVNIAGSGAPEDIELIVEFTAPGATPMTAAEVAARSDLVVLATPLHRYRTLPVPELTGKIVVDAMNYWVPANGTMSEFAAADHGTSEIVATFLVGSRLVKSLNHIGYHDLEVHGRPPGTPGRRALAVASDDAAAKATVAGVLDRLGYDTVDAGGLAAGRALEPDTAIFDGIHTAAQLRELLSPTPLSLAA
jgi:predicted dinucleotide-binding enzyme